ncbi:MAG TPA: hypothetical protein DCE44_08110 [Verrucomicrobiales bacterium]|nr:hypothetical protein [Verrucomicrobiales bacterium]
MSSAPPPMGRILVVRGGALGDFVVTLPVLSALRRAFPDASVELMAYPQFAALAIASRLADRVIPIESRPLAGFFGRNGDLDFELSKYFAGVHLLVSYLYDPDFIFQTNVARVSRAQFVLAPHRPDEASQIHVTRQLLKPLEQLAIFDADPQPRIEVTPEPVSAPRWLAVHPGSGSAQKNWPESAWAALLQQVVHDSDLNVCLVGGEAEGERLERLAAGLPTSRVELFRSRPLPELACRLGRCLGFVGHDSGVAHLAAAVGLPGLVLWGPSNAAVWRPYSDRFGRINAGRGLDLLSVDQVSDELRRRWMDWQGATVTAPRI